MPKLSVIVPVYNVADCIERCARSLFGQTLDDIEYIFVNDCTPDDSMTVLERVLEDYPHRRPQTRMLNLPQNCGQAEARRQGMCAAKGDYIIQCDSDDWTDVTMYEKLYAFAVSGDYDMVWCDYYRSDGMNHTVVPQECNPQKNEILKAFLSGRLIASVCNRLYRRELQQGAKFIYPTANMTEDFVISTQITLRSSRIGYLNEPLYYYYWNPNSICINPSEQAVIRNYHGMRANTELVLDILEKNVAVGEFRREIECKKCFCKEILIPVLNKREYRELWRSTYPEVNPRILFNPLIPRNTKIRAFCLLWGMYPLYTFLKNRSV